MFGFLRKTKIDTSKIVDEIEKTVFQWAKPLGFKKYGRTFNRVVDGDLVQVIHFQNGCPQKGIHGVLWVNLGVRVLECTAFPDEQKPYYKEYECNIRCGLDEYIDRKENPYDLRNNPQDIAADIIMKLETVVLPIFDDLSSREKIVENLERHAAFNSFNNHLVERDIGLILKRMKTNRAGE